MNARIGVVVLCAAALVACSSIPRAPETMPPAPPKCATADECARNGCEIRSSNEGERLFICRDSRPDGCWRHRSWNADELQRGAHPIAFIGPWHCPGSPEPPAAPAESAGPPSPEVSERAHAPKGAPRWVVVDDDVGASAPRPRDPDQARHVTRIDMIIAAVFAMAVYLVAHSPEYPAAKCQTEGEQNCRR